MKIISLLSCVLFISSVYLNAQSRDYTPYAEKRQAEADQTLEENVPERLREAMELIQEQQDLGDPPFTLKTEEIQLELGLSSQEIGRMSAEELKTRIQAQILEQRNQTSPHHIRNNSTTTRPAPPSLDTIRKTNLPDGYVTFSEDYVKEQHMSGAQQRLSEGVARAYSGKIIPTEEGEDTHWGTTRLARDAEGQPVRISSMTEGGMLDEAAQLSTGGTVTVGGEFGSETRTVNAATSLQLSEHLAGNPEAAMLGELDYTRATSKARSDAWRQQEHVSGYLEAVKEDPELQRALDIVIPEPDPRKPWWGNERKEAIVFDSPASFLAYATVLRAKPDSPSEEGLIPGQLERFWAPLNIYVHGADVRFRNPKTGVHVGPNPDVTLRFEIYPTEYGSRIKVYYNGSWANGYRYRIMRRWDTHWPWVESLLNGIRDHLEIIYGEGNMIHANRQHFHALSEAEHYQRNLEAYTLYLNDLLKALQTYKTTWDHAEVLLSQAKTRLQDRKDALEALNTEKAEALAEIDAALEALEEIDPETQEKITALETEITELTTQLEDLLASKGTPINIADLEQQVADAKQAVADLMDDLDINAGKLSNLQQEKQTITAQFNEETKDLQQKIADLGALRNEQRTKAVETGMKAFEYGRWQPTEDERLLNLILDLPHDDPQREVYQTQRDANKLQLEEYERIAFDTRSAYGITHRAWQTKLQELSNASVDLNNTIDMINNELIPPLETEQNQIIQAIRDANSQQKILERQLADAIANPSQGSGEYDSEKELELRTAIQLAEASLKEIKSTAEADKIATKEASELKRTQTITAFNKRILAAKKDIETAEADVVAAADKAAEAREAYLTFRRETQPEENHLRSLIAEAETQYNKWLRVARRYAPEKPAETDEVNAYLSTYGSTTAAGVTADTAATAFAYALETGEVDPEDAAEYEGLPALGSTAGPKSRKLPGG